MKQKLFKAQYEIIPLAGTKYHQQRIERVPAIIRGYQRQLATLQKSKERIASKVYADPIRRKQAEGRNDGAIRRAKKEIAFWEKVTAGELVPYKRHINVLWGFPLLQAEFSTPDCLLFKSEQIMPPRFEFDDWEWATQRIWNEAGCWHGEAKRLQLVDRQITSSDAGEIDTTAPPAVTVTATWAEANNANLVTVPNAGEEGE